jgi:hypothetical protein
MSNVVQFPKQTARTKAPQIADARPVTLFLHVRRTTLIAHLSGRVAVQNGRADRVGKS